MSRIRSSEGMTKARWYFPVAIAALVFLTDAPVTNSLHVNSVIKHFTKKLPLSTTPHSLSWSIHPKVPSHSNVYASSPTHSTIEPAQKSSFSWKISEKYLKVIPNTLTILRVILILPFAAAYVTQRNSLACDLFILASLTDWLDGYLARKLRVSSNFGAFLDPVADKLMVATALVLLVMAIPVWWFSGTVALIICREVFVSALREWMAQRGLSATVKVGNLGKFKTATQMIAITLLLDAGPAVVTEAAVKAVATVASSNTLKIAAMKSAPLVQGGAGGWSLSGALRIPRAVLFALGLGIFFVSAVLTVLSGLEYLLAAWPLLSGGRVGGNSDVGNMSNNSKIVGDESGSSGISGGEFRGMVSDVDPNKTPFDVP